LLPLVRSILLMALLVAALTRTGMLRLAKAVVRVGGLRRGGSLVDCGWYPAFGLESFAFQPSYQITQIRL
jgi:hypothetical protein